jgi:DNA (cytosine-5)-methyltransferase 1
MNQGHGIMLQQAVEDLLPTPVAALGESGSAAIRSGYRREPTTAGAIEDLLPTPSATEYGSNQSPSEGAAVRPSLPGLVELLPTPLAEQKGPGSKRGANAQGGGLTQRDPQPATNASSGRRSRRPVHDAVQAESGPDEPDAERSGVPVEWGRFAPAIRRWEALHGRAPEPLCFFRGVDARAAAGLERSRLSALGDGVQMQAGWFLGAGLMTLAEEMGL